MSLIGDGLLPMDDHRAAMAWNRRVAPTRCRSSRRCCSHALSSGTVIGRLVGQRKPVQRGKRGQQRRHVPPAVGQKIGNHVVRQAKTACPRIGRERRGLVVVGQRQDLEHEPPAQAAAQIVAQWHRRRRHAAAATRCPPRRLECVVECEETPLRRRVGHVDPSTATSAPGAGGSAGTAAEIRRRTPRARCPAAASDGRLQQVGLPDTGPAPQHDARFRDFAGRQAPERRHGLVIASRQEIGERRRLRRRQFEDQLLHRAGG